MKGNNDKWIQTMRHRMDQAPVSFDAGGSWIRMEQKIRSFYRIRLWRRIGLSAACAAAIIVPLLFLSREEATERIRPVQLLELRYTASTLSYRAERPRRLIEADKDHHTAPVTVVPAGEIVMEEPAQQKDVKAANAEQQEPQAATPKMAKPGTPANLFIEDVFEVKKRSRMMLAASGVLAVRETRKMSSLPPGDAFMDENKLMSTGILQNNETLNSYEATILPVNYVTYEYKHRLPVSFGLVASFPLSERWYVESGLFATRLASSIYSVHSMRQDDPVFITDRVLWYLGVPLKIRWNFLQSRVFTAYAAAGGALEKCIYFGYEQAMEDEKMQLTPRDMPVMWSVQATLGAQYNIVKGVGLFVEPGISFYPENSKMPVKTIRTDKPLNFNINAGFRFSF
ncbi:MAG TPA: hypothetical protein PLG35_08390 [Bacteroidales bacterium]|jgi:hypothetical protein|nr:hypothetical protein [Bacteroidales bacterium]